MKRASDRPLLMDDETQMLARMWPGKKYADRFRQLTENERRIYTTFMHCSKDAPAAAVAKQVGEYKQDMMAIIGSVTRVLLHGHSRVKFDGDFPSD